MATTGNSTYVKSMNGIITFDDGSGTVIEDGAIQTDSFSTTNFNATNLSATDVQTATLTATGNLNALSVTTDTILATTAVGSRIVDIFDNLGANDTINIGSDCATKLAGAVVIEPAESNFYASSMVVTPTTIKADNLSGVAVGDAISLYTATTGNISLGGTGKINLGNTINITGNTVESSASSSTINMFNNITTGTVNLLTGIRTAGALNIASNTSNLLNTAPVNIGGTNTTATNGGLSRITLNLNGDNIWSNTNTLTSFRSGGGINLATFVGSTNGTINIGNEAGTTTTVTIGRNGNGKQTVLDSTQTLMNGELFFPTSTINISCNASATFLNFFSNFSTGGVNFFNGLTTGYVNIANSFVLFTNALRFNNVSTTVGLLDNLTSAITCLIGGAGSVKISETSATSTVSIGNTTGTTAGSLGNVVIGNGSNSTTTANNGICTINKLKVGLNGTPYRYMIMENSIGAGISGSFVYSIPGAPTGMGTPIIFVTINVTIANSVNMYVVNATALNDTQFRYRKRFWNGAVLSDASTESINYVAYWL